MSHEHLESNRQPNGQFGSGPASEAGQVDLVGAESTRARETVRALQDRVRADFPDVRSVVLEESEMGAYLVAARDGDGVEFLDAADLTDYDDIAEDVSGVGVIDGDVEPGPVEDDGTSRTVIRIPQTV